jgi:hypothetical protein
MMRSSSSASDDGFRGNCRRGNHPRRHCPALIVDAARPTAVRAGFGTTPQFRHKRISACGDSGTNSLAPQSGHRSSSLVSNHSLRLNGCESALILQTSFRSSQLMPRSLGGRRTKSSPHPAVRKTRVTRKRPALSPLTMREASPGWVPQGLSLSAGVSGRPAARKGNVRVTPPAERAAATSTLSNLFRQSRAGNSAFSLRGGGCSATANEKGSLWRPAL